MAFITVIGSANHEASYSLSTVRFYIKVIVRLFYDVLYTAKRVSAVERTGRL